MQKRIIAGLCIALTFSALAAFVFYDKSLISYAKWFVGTLLLQFIIQYVVTVVLDARTGVKIKQYEYASLEAYHRTFQPVPCPCHVKHVQAVQLKFDKPVAYKCEKCHKSLSAYAEIISVLSTIPTNNEVAIKDNLDKLRTEITNNEHTPESD